MLPTDPHSRLASARSLCAFVIVSALVVASCGDLRPLDAPCTPPETQSCECPGALASVSVCRFNGTFSACLCGGASQPDAPFDPSSTGADGGLADAGVPVANDGGAGFLDAGATPSDGGTSAVDAGVRDGGVRDGGTIAVDGGASRVTYRAYLAATALDRIFLYKADTSRNLCTVLILVSPSEQRGLDIFTPTGWATERGYMTDRASDCTPPPAAPQGRFVSLASGNGTVLWEANPNGTTYPCTLDVRATVRPEGGMGWPPRVDTLEATNVRVENVMCP